MNLLLLSSSIGLITVVIYLGIYILLHFQTSKYNPIRHAVSDYAIGKTKKLFNTYVVFSIISIAAVWISLINIQSASIIPVLVSLAFIFLLLGRIFVLVFPTNLEGQKLTGTEVLHYIGAIISFTGAYICMTSSFFISLANERLIYGILVTISFTALPALLLVIITLLLKPLRQIFGLSERIFLTLFGVWLLTINVFLTYISFK